MLQCPPWMARSRCGEAFAGGRLAIPRAVSCERSPVFLDGFAFDQKHLTDRGEVESGIERRLAPHPPCLDTAVIGRCGLDEAGGASGREPQRDIPPTWVGEP